MQLVVRACRGDMHSLNPNIALEAVSVSVFLWLHEGMMSSIACAEWARLTFFEQFVYPFKSAHTSMKDAVEFSDSVRAEVSVQVNLGFKVRAACSKT